jgi:hypothetical protein
MLLRAYAVDTAGENRKTSSELMFIGRALDRKNALGCNNLAHGRIFFGPPAVTK